MPTDHAIAELARRQHGVVSRAQLRAIGLTPRMIDGRVTAGRLHRLHRGVFAVGHLRVGAHGRWLAAVLACGDGALLSHRSAAALWGLRPTSRARVDVCTPSGRSSAPPIVHLHRTRRLSAADHAMVEGIPVTSVARTLVDVAAVLRPDAVARAIHEATVLRLIDVRAIEAAIGTGRGRAGVARLRRALAVPDAGVRRRELEHRFLELCRDAGLPTPRCNAHVPAAGRLVEVDAWFPAQRLAVELDGVATHLTPRAFESDRVRDAALLREDIPVLRVTWRRLTAERTQLLDDLRALLGRTVRR